MQMRRYVLHTLEGIDHDVVNHVAPQHDVAPGGHPLPLVGCAKPPGLQDVLQVAVLVLDGPPVLLPGEVLEDVGALAELCQLLEAGKKRNGGHDADLGHLPPPVAEDKNEDDETKKRRQILIPGLNLQLVTQIPKQCNTDSKRVYLQDQTRQKYEYRKWAQESAASQCILLAEQRVRCINSKRCTKPGQSAQTLHTLCMMSALALPYANTHDARQL